ncbi:hypothetical protein Tco_0860279 [Tanacetum coccineum]|uniref:Reverse transcriptase domain-containing protein n=1 Tax=Tanacetum coccineum TaxID=301880 RepID=A0ABQ5BHG9_9ASTR
MSKLREMFQTWLQQRQEQVVNLDTYTPEPSQCRKIPICYDDDDEENSLATQEYLKKFSSAITPDLPKLDSLIMEDKHLDTIPEPESNKLIKSSVEDLVHTPSEYDGIVEADFDPKGDIRFIENLMYDNSFPRPPETLKDDSETVINSNNDYSLSDNDSLYSDDIDYDEASPPYSELVSLEVVEIVIPEIEALKDNPTPSSDFVTKSSSTSLNFFLEETNTFDNSLPESKTFCFNLEEISSGSPTSYLDLSLPDYEAFFCDSEPDSGDFTMDVVEDIFDNPTREPRVHVPNVLPTHPPFIWIRISLFLRFLSPDKFSISFIRDPPFPMIDTLLLFSFENEAKVVNPGILDEGEEKSPHLLSHRGFKAFQLIFESPMMIFGGDIPILDVPFLHFYPP